METTPRRASWATDVLRPGETLAMVTPIAGGRLDRSSFALRAGGAEYDVAMYLSDLGHARAIGDHAALPSYERLVDPPGLSQEDLSDGPPAGPGSQGA